MPRALIVGCGEAGTLAGAELIERGWTVRGTTRDTERVGTIEAAGIEGAVADPDRVGSIVELLADVTILVWPFATAGGDEELVRELHSHRLPSLLEKVVDTPVRGIVFETAGEGVGAPGLDAAEAAMADAEERWRIPVVRISGDRSDPGRWAGELADAVERAIGLS